MRIIGNDQTKTRQTQAVASGALPNGKPVVVNSDGTVSFVAVSASEMGSPTVFEAGFTQDTSCTFDSNSNKVVIAYTDRSNGYYGTAVVGTVSGTSISFGTPVVFDDGSSYGTAYNSITFDSSNNKVVIAYQENANGTGMAIVGTVSGTSISFGSRTNFDSGVQVTNISATFDNNSNKVVIAWKDGNNSDYGTAIVGTVSGTSISFGTATIYNSSNSTYNSTTFDSNSNKVVVAFKDNNNADYGTAVVGTVSGTSISFGSKVVFESARSDWVSATFDSSSNKVVVAYKDVGNSDYGTAVVGTVSGTSISFGTPVVFNTATANYVSITFDSSSNKVTIAYQDNGNSGYGTFISGTVSGTSISFDAEIVFETATTDYTSITFDSSNNKVVVAYRDQGNSLKGTSVVFKNSSTNLTAENYIGMSQGEVDFISVSEATGSAVIFEDANTQDIAATFDSTNNKVVFAYMDRGNSDYGTAVVGTVSGTSISFGTPVVFNSAQVTYLDAGFDENAGKAVIVYRDAGGSYHGKAIVGTVSGTSISFGTEATFNAAESQSMGIIYEPTAQKMVISYRDEGNSNYGTAIVGTISGTSISFGSEAVFESASTADTRLTYDASAGKVVVSYRDTSNSNTGTAAVGTVSGTSISFGTPVVFNAGASVTSNIDITYDSNAQKVVICFKDGNNSNYGRAVVGSVSGTAISFGDPVTFLEGTAEFQRIVYDSAAKKIVIVYEDTSNTEYGTVISGTVSGTSITFDSPSVFESAEVEYTNATYDSNEEKVVIVYRDSANTNKGTSVVYQPAYSSTTSYPVSNGNHVLIDTKGGISKNQLSLTAGKSYYVQTDGTITTTAGDPSVFAGTAVSSTKLIVKG